MVEADLRSADDALEQMPLMFEPVAAMAELGELLLSPVYYGMGVPRGDGHRVLVVPGFMGSDSYLMILAGWLARVGYRPAHVGGGPSMGSIEGLLKQVIRRTEALAEGGRRISLIGHSLGGMLARLTALARPDLVSHVIMLGSSVTGDRSTAHPFVAELSRLLLTSDDEDTWMLRRSEPLPPSVQSTSIYSRQDAVVTWRSCKDPDPRATNLIVSGSHVGLTWNAAVYRHLAERLLY